MPPVEDENLAQEAANGNQQAFRTLFVRYRKMVYSIAWRIALNTEDALDITQNVFVAILKKIDTFKGKGSLKSWISSVTANQAISYIRKSSRKKEVPTEPEILSYYAERFSSSEPSDQRKILLAKQRMEWVEKTMKQLPPQQRAILTLRLHENMTPHEIAQRLEIPGSQVRSQLCNAIARIRKILSQKGILEINHEVSK